MTDIRHWCRWCQRNFVWTSGHGSRRPRWCCGRQSRGGLNLVSTGSTMTPITTRARTTRSAHSRPYGKSRSASEFWSLGSLRLMRSTSSTSSSSVAAMARIGRERHLLLRLAKVFFCWATSPTTLGHSQGGWSTLQPPRHSPFNFATMKSSVGSMDESSSKDEASVLASSARTLRSREDLPGLLERGAPLPPPVPPLEVR